MGKDTTLSKLREQTENKIMNRLNELDLAGQIQPILIDCDGLGILKIHWHMHWQCEWYSEGEGTLLDIQQLNSISPKKLKQIRRG